MKKCCGLCPYSRKDTLYLRPERAEDFAYSAENPYNDFVCHKTGVEDEDDFGGSKIVRGEKSLTCAGFASMQNNINGGKMEDNHPIDPNAFEDSWQMIEHHTQKWEDDSNKSTNKKV